MFCDTSVDMQSPDASMMDLFSVDVSMMSLSIQDGLNEEDSIGMEELTRRLGELNTRPVLQPMLNHSRTDKVVLESIEDKLCPLRTLTSTIANDQAEIHMLQQKLTDIQAVAIDSLASTGSMMGSDGLADSDMTWLLTEWGCQAMLDTCIRDWSFLALGWVNGVIHDLDAFDDKVVESMDALRELRGDIQNSNNVLLQSGNGGGVCVAQVISTMQCFQLDEQINLTLPKRPSFPQLDTGFPFGFLSYEQEEFNQRAKDIHTLGVNLANGHHTEIGRNWV